MRDMKGLTNAGSMTQPAARTTDLFAAALQALELAKTNSTAASKESIAVNAILW